MLPFFYSFFFPLILGTLVETILVRSIASLIGWKQITWSHAFVFSFFALLVAIAARHINDFTTVQVGLFSAFVLSLALHAALGAFIFRSIPVGAPKSNAAPAGKNNPRPTSKKATKIQVLGPTRGAAIASLSFVVFAALFFALSSGLSRLPAAAT